MLRMRSDAAAAEGAVKAEREGPPALSFRNVTFSYEPDGEPVIRNLSAEIRRGEFVMSKRAKSLSLSARADAERARCSAW